MNISTRFMRSASGGNHERHFMYLVESSGNSCNKSDIKRQSQHGRRNIFLFYFSFLKASQQQENYFFIFVERPWFVKIYGLYLDRKSELDTHIRGIILCCMLFCLTHVHISDLIKSSLYCYLTCFHSAHISSSSVESTASAHNVNLIQQKYGIFKCLIIKQKFSL